MIANLVVYVVVKDMFSHSELVRVEILLKKFAILFE
jgi:hypothetical protein